MRTYKMFLSFGVLLGYFLVAIYAAQAKDSNHQKTFTWEVKYSEGTKTLKRTFDVHYKGERIPVIEKALPGHLFELRDGIQVNAKNVDCRYVAENMVFTLISHHTVSNVVEHDSANKSKVNREERSYQERIPLDSAFAASYFKTITIKAGDKPFSQYQCKPIKINKADGTQYEIPCGGLTIYVAPKAKEFVFNPDNCEKMDQRACENLYQVQACGLMHVQKAIYTKAETQDGLADKLTKWIAQKRRTLYVKEKNRPAKTDSHIFESLPIDEEYLNASAVQ